MRYQVVIFWWNGETSLAHETLRTFTKPQAQKTQQAYLSSESYKNNKRNIKAVAVLSERKIETSIIAK